MPRSEFTRPTPGPRSAGRLRRGPMRSRHIVKSIRSYPKKTISYPLFRQGGGRAEAFVFHICSYVRNLDPAWSAMTPPCRAVNETVLRVEMERCLSA